MTPLSFSRPGRWWLPALLLCVFPAGAEELRFELERTYRGWSGAMSQRSLSLWQQHTAASRQVLTRNYVISRKADWPAAIFDLPFRLPEIATLRHIATFERGDTANLIYFGRVDFGLLEGNVPENILLLKFLREKGRWKFDNTKFINLESDPGVRQLILNDELEFLQDPEFQPSGELPPVPRSIEGFDHPGEIWVASVGYETTVKIGDLHVTQVGNNIVTDVVIGGLSRSGLPISVGVRDLPLPPGAERTLAVEIYALRPGKPAVRVWEHRPPEEKALEPLATRVFANAVTMQDKPGAQKSQ